MTACSAEVPWLAESALVRSDLHLVAEAPDGSLAGYVDLPIASRTAAPSSSRWALIRITYGGDWHLPRVPDRFHETAPGGGGTRLYEGAIFAES